MINLDYDIVVIGGGCSGISAAIAARRFGAKVLLIEREGCPGGMSTTGMLNIWCGTSESRFYKRICDRTTRVIKGRAIYSPEKLKLEYINELEDAGVELLLHSLMTDCSLDGDGNITNIILDGKSGKIQVSAKIFIDSTGDGDLAALCGVPFSIGRDDDGLSQPMSLEFMVGGVDDSRAVYANANKCPGIAEKMKEYLADGRISRPAGHIILIEGIEPSTAFVNMTNVTGVDGTNVFDLTKAELIARKQMSQIICFLRECVPGYENCFELASGNYVGVRESRRFKGLYSLTEQDISSCRLFDDYIVKDVGYCFGVHDPKGVGVTGRADGRGKYSIPYRCFVPIGVKNLLLNGRCISGTHLALSNYRVMPICFAMGDGVGSCAAVAIRDRLCVCELGAESIREVQELL